MRVSLQVVNVESENLKLNGLSGTACQLDWRDRDAAARLGKFDLILCADLLYASATVKVLQLAPTSHFHHPTIYFPRAVLPAGLAPCLGRLISHCA